jgi:nitroreductase
VETWDAIRSRRNVRGYKDRQIVAEDLDRIAEAARRTPSSMNQQPWDFVVLTDPERLRSLAGVWRYAEHVAGSAATVALVAALPEDRDGRDWVLFDLGQACMSIVLAAADLGIGSCHAAVDDQVLARQVLGLPEDRTCVALVSLGYPAGRPLTPIEHPDRRPSTDVLHHGTW